VFGNMDGVGWERDTTPNHGNERERSMGDE
jgi:hypothetical protein